MRAWKEALPWRNYSYLAPPYQNAHTLRKKSYFTLNPLSSIHLSEGMKIFILLSILGILLFTGDIYILYIIFGDNLDVI